MVLPATLQKKTARGRKTKLSVLAFAALGAAVGAGALYSWMFPYEDLFLQSNLLSQSSSPTKAAVDVMDVGASKGEGSILFLQSRLQKLRMESVLAPHTVGIDIDTQKVSTCQNAVKGKQGIDCIEADVLKLYGNGGGSKYMVDKLGTPVVTGITFWHVLEHMPTVSLAKEIWKSAAGVASHFASFRGPVFDDADVFDQVEPKGMHRFFENWRGHPCHFTSSDLKEAMLSDTKKKPTAHIILIHKPITSSASNVILPPGAAVDSHHYNEKEHGPKRIVEFPKVLYEEMRACAFYGPSLDDSKLDEQMDEQLLQLFRFLFCRCFGG